MDRISREVTGYRSVKEWVFGSGRSMGFCVSLPCPIEFGPTHPLTQLVPAVEQLTTHVYLVLRLRTPASAHFFACPTPF